jgi:transposase
MSQPFDPSQFPDLPPDVVMAFAAQQAALTTARFEAAVERAARQNEQVVVAEKDAFITDLKALIEKLEGQVQDYRRMKFGPKSEKLVPARLELALEDLETAIAETQAQIAAVEEKIAASEPDPENRKPRAPRKARALPEHLPRAARLVEPDSIVWSPWSRHWSERQWRRGCGDMVRIAEGETSRRHGFETDVEHRAAGLHPCVVSGSLSRSA